MNPSFNPIGFYEPIRATARNRYPCRMGAIKTIAAAAGIGLAAITTAPAAQADQWDFVSYLDNRGVAYSSVLDIIETGKYTCRYLRQGQPVGQVMQGIETLGFPVQEQAFIVIGAAQHMCPDMMPAVQAYAA